MSILRASFRGSRRYTRAWSTANLHSLPTYRTSVSILCCSGAFEQLRHPPAERAAVTRFSKALENHAAQTRTPRCNFPHSPTHPACYPCPARHVTESITTKNAALRALGEDEIHGITKFTDMTKEMFLELFRPHSDDALPKASVAVPRKSADGIKMHDWRESNVVTPVKDQVRSWWFAR